MRLIGKILIAVLLLAPVAARADDVVQESFKFVDHNMGAGDLPYALSVMRIGNTETAALLAPDDKGKVASVTFTSPEEWNSFIAEWQKAKDALASQGPFDPTKVWSYTDSEKTKLIFFLDAFSSLSFGIIQKGMGNSSFAIEKDQVPDFDAALAKVSAHFKSGT